MANSTVSRSNGGIKMLPAGSPMALVWQGSTQVFVFSKQCFSVPVYKQPLPFYEYQCHHSIYYT